MSLPPLRLPPRIWEIPDPPVLTSEEILMFIDNMTASHTL